MVGLPRNYDAAQLLISKLKARDQIKPNPSSNQAIFIVISNSQATTLGVYSYLQTDTFTHCERNAPVATTVVPLCLSTSP